MEQLLMDGTPVQVMTLCQMDLEMLSWRMMKIKSIDLQQQAQIIHCHSQWLIILLNIEVREQMAS